MQYTEQTCRMHLRISVTIIEPRCMHTYKQYCGHMPGTKVYLVPEDGTQAEEGGHDHVMHF